nr:MAG: non-structural polyprotein [Avian associated bastrovirus 2]
MFESTGNRTLLEAHDTAYLTQQLRCAITIPAVSPNAFEALKTMYEPVMLKPVPTRMQRPPSECHQIGQSHLIIAEQYLNEFVKNHEEFIEIGPNPASLMRKAIGKRHVHGCTLRSARDQSRYIIAAASNEVRNFRPNNTQITGIQSGGATHRALYEDIQKLASGIPTETFCTRGWQNCNARAPIAISNHSLYDITLQDLAIGMLHHNTSLIRAYMHFPVEALEVEDWSNHEHGYCFKVVNGNIRFGWIGDTAFSYNHDLAVWLSYLKTSVFDTPFGFSVSIEKTRRMGSQFELTITKITAAERFTASLPAGFTGLIKVPNFRHLARKLCKRGFKDERENYIFSDAYKVRKLMDYVNARRSDGRTLEVVKGYARTLVSEIRLGQKIAEHRWNCTTEDFNDLCISIYILSIYQGRLHGEITAECMAHMDEIERDFGWFKQLRHRITKKIVSTFVGEVTHNHKINHVISEDTSNIFHRVCVQFFKDHESDGTSVEHFHDTPVFFDYNEVEEPLPEDVFIPPAEAAAQEVVPDLTIPEWALGLGFVTAQKDVQVGPEYLSEFQHETLIAECKLNATKAEKGLKIALEEAAKVLSTRTPKQLHVENMFLLTGVPGAAKTADIITKIVPAAIERNEVGTVIKPVLVLCPTAALRDKYNVDLADMGVAHTIHTGLRALLTKPWALVIVEEVFTVPVAYFNFIAEKYHTLGVGDPKQIEHVDFTKMWVDSMMMSHIMHAIPRAHKSVTHRCPQDVIAIPAIKAAYPGITSTSRKDNSIEHVGPNFQNSNSVVVTFTQMIKNQMTGTNCENAITAHECQGQTFTSVILHYCGTHGENMLLDKSPNHLVVALTRHTNKLFIRDVSENKTLTTYMNAISPLTHIADQANIDLESVQPMEEGRPTCVVAEEAYEAPKESYKTARTNAAIAIEIVSRFNPLPPQREQVANSVNQLPYEGGATGTLRLAALGQEENKETKPQKIFRFQGPQHVKITRMSHRFELARTNLERLAHVTKNMKASIAEKTAQHLYDLLVPEFSWHVPDDLKHQTFLEALDRMNARGQEMDVLKDATDWTDHKVNIVKSFLKSQQKPMGGKDALLVDKAGQGIAAWEKTLNLMMTCYVRTIEHVMTNQSIGKVYITSQLDDKTTMAKLEKENEPGDEYLANDWTQFDSNQNNASRMLYSKLLALVGCPPDLIEAWNQHSTKRKVACAELTLNVTEKLDSGAPNTFSKNCAFNAAICLDVMKNIRVLYIKGDDSLARGRGVEFDKKKMKKYGTECGYKFKPEKTFSGEYISFIVNNQGVAFDLIRVASKILSRAYEDRKDFENYQTAIRSQFGSLTICEAANMCKINSLHYSGTTRDEHTFDSLYSFILDFGLEKIKFSELVESEYIHLRSEGQRAIQSIKQKHTVANTIIQGVGKIFG